MLDGSFDICFYTRVIKIKKHLKIKGENCENSKYSPHGLSKQFGKQPILQDLSLSVKEGDIYGLIGKMVKQS